MRDGRAEIRCALPESRLCIEWLIEETNFPFFLKQECTDGVFLVERPDGSFDAHLLECKITINQDTRHKAKVQMAWTLVGVLALAGALGLRIQRVVLYTAYCEDKLGAAPGLAKVPPGRTAETGEEAEVVETLRGQFDWPEQEIELRFFEGRFAHHAVRLTPPVQQGEPARGACALSVAS